MGKPVCSRAGERHWAEKKIASVITLERLWCSCKVMAICQQASGVRSFRLLQRIFFKTTFDNKDLPCPQTALNTADERLDLAKIQATEKMLTADSYTLHAEGTVNTYSQYKTQETVILYVSGGTLNFEVRLAQESTTQKLSVSMVRNSGSCSFKAGVEAIWSVTHHSACLLFLITVSNPFNMQPCFSSPLGPVMLLSHWAYKQVTVFPVVVHSRCSLPAENRQTSFATTHVQARSLSKKMLNYLAQMWSFKKVVLISDGCAALFKSKLTVLPLSHTLICLVQSPLKRSFLALTM